MKTRDAASLRGEFSRWRYHPRMPMSRDAFFTLLAPFAIGFGVGCTRTGTGTETHDGSDGDSGTGDDGGATSPSQVCDAWAEHTAGCYQQLYGEVIPPSEVAYYAMYCAQLLGNADEEYGPGCGQLMADVYACLSTLPCDAFLNGGPDQCAAEQAAADPCFDDGSTEPGTDTATDTGHENECGPENNSSWDQGQCTCEPGYDWCDFEDETNFSCCLPERP